MEPTQNRGRPGPNPWGMLAAGSQLVVYVLAGVLFGRWLDARWNTGPWFLLTGTMAGIGVGLYNLIREFSQPRQR